MSAHTIHHSQLSINCLAQKMQQREGLHGSLWSSCQWFSTKSQCFPFLPFLHMCSQLPLLLNEQAMSVPAQILFCLPRLPVHAFIPEHLLGKPPWTALHPRVSLPFPSCFSRVFIIQCISFHCFLVGNFNLRVLRVLCTVISPRHRTMLAQMSRSSLNTHEMNGWVIHIKPHPADVSWEEAGLFWKVVQQNANFIFKACIVYSEVFMDW